VNHQRVLQLRKNLYLWLKYIKRDVIHVSINWHFQFTNCPIELDENTYLGGLFGEALSTPWGTQMWVQTKNNEGVRNQRTLPSSQHFGRVKGRAKPLRWIRKNWQASITHMNLHKTNTRWLVHRSNTFGARTSHGQLGLTRLTTAWTWGKPPPSPFYYTLRLSTGVTSKWLFVPGLPSGSPEILAIGTLATFGVHNFMCKPPLWWGLRKVIALIKSFPTICCTSPAC
jgi:hypothetical protein